MSENNSSEENVTRAFIDEKLNKITENSASVEASVRKFVRSSSETLNALSVAVSEDTLGRLKDFLEKSEEFFKKNILDNSVTTLNDEAAERRYQKFLKDLSFFETNLENGLSDKFNDLNEYQHVMLEEIKKAFSNFADSLENDKDDLFVSAAGDIKQIKADITELSGQIGTFNVLAKERVETLNKQTENVVAQTGKGIVDEIRIMRTENATAEFVKSAYEQTTFRVRNEVNLLKTELTQQLHRLLGKTSSWDEVKFLAEETARAIKSNITETGILKKYLKDIKNAADTNTESVSILKDTMTLLTNSGMTDISDKIDVIYDNITFLNSLALSSESLNEKLNSFETKLETELNKITERLDEPSDKPEGQIVDYSDKLVILEEIAENIKSVKAQSESFDKFESLLNDANNVISQIGENLKEVAAGTDKVKEMLNNGGFDNNQNVADNNFEQIKTYLEENLKENGSAEISQNIYDLQGIFMNAEKLLEETSGKVDVICENLNALNAEKEKDDEFKADFARFKELVENKVNSDNQNNEGLRADIAKIRELAEQNSNREQADVSGEINSLNETLSNTIGFVEETSGKVDVIYENLNALNAEKEKDDEFRSDFAKFKELVENNANSENEKIEKLNSLNEMFANTAGLVEETAEKTDIIFENLNALNAEKEKDDEFKADFARFKELVENKVNSDNQNNEGLRADIAKIRELAEQNSNGEQAGVSGEINSLNEMFANTAGLVEETAEKTDIIFENLNALNAEKEESDKFRNNFEEFKNNFTQSFGEFDGKLAELKDFISNSGNISGDLELIKDRFCADCEKIANDLSAAMQNFDPEKLNIKNIEILGFENFANVLSEKTKENAQKTEEILNILNTPQNWSSEENTSEKLDDLFIQISKISDKIESVSETFKSALNEQTDFNERITDLERSVNLVTDNVAGIASDFKQSSFATIEEISQKTSEKLSITVNEISEKINSVLDKMSEETQRQGTTVLAEVTATINKVSEDLKNAQETVLDAVKSVNNTENNGINETSSVLNNIKERVEALYSINSTLDGIILAINNGSLKSEEIIEEIRAMKENAGDMTDLASLTERLDKLQKRFDETYSQIRLITENADDFTETSALRESLDEIQKRFDETSSKNCEALTVAIKENTDGIGKLSGDFEELKNCVDKINTVTNLPSEIFEGIKNGSIKTERILKTVSELSKRLENLKPLTSNIESILHKTGVGFGKAKEAYRKLEELKEYVEKTGEFANHADEICNVTNVNSEKIDGLNDKLTEIENKISVLDAVDEALRDLADHVQTYSEKTSFEDLADTLSLGIESILSQLKEDESFKIAVEHKLSDIEENVADVNRNTGKFSDNIEKITGFLSNFEKNAGVNDDEIKNLKKRLDGIKNSVVNSEEYSQILLESFGYLAEWIDKAGGCLNDILEEVKKSEAKNKEMSETVDNLGSGMVALIENGVSESTVEKLNKEIKLTNRNVKNLKNDLGALISYEFNDLKENIGQNPQKSDDFSQVSDKLQNLEDNMTTTSTELRQISQDLAKVKEFSDKFAQKDSFENIKNVLKLIVKTIEDKFTENGNRIDKINTLVASGSSNDDLKAQLNKIIDKSEQTVQLFENNQNIINNLELKIENVDLKLNSFEQRMTSLEGNIAKLISYLEDDE